MVILKKGGFTMFPRFEKKFFVNRIELELAYNKLGSLQKVADRYNVSKKLILNYMKKFNIKRNKRWKPADLAIKIKELAGKMMNGNKISCELKLTQTRIYQVAKQFDINICDNYHPGFITSHSGYILIHKPDHHYADSKGYVRKHRLVMEEYLGRYLDDFEKVHHCNMDVTDNQIENLELISIGEHTSIHHKGKMGRGPDKQPRKNSKR